MKDKTSVVIKTTAGLSAVKPQNNELLLREARNLLILIDGRKTLEQYQTQLNNMNMFKEVGGVEQYFQLLSDMELIEFSDNEHAVTASSQHRQKDSLLEQSTETSPFSTQSSLDQVEANARDDPLPPEPGEIVSSTMNPGVLQGKIRAKAATLIEQYAGPEQTWGLLMKLESSTSDTELMRFLENLVKNNTGAISKKTAGLVKSIRKANQIQG